ncbi:cytochrome P450 [Amorphoplanes digitatis]|uniref:Cytochrome P450 n=1 Tax=Actinoplanes digitatis TaxID=1868 RepID=A0A7W7I281_9ACTN|nr:cytochrome P450 [Actinoplanes digitatis]MBB4764913.1 cytochrome P450 [Actinoplanes digitatis]
MATYDPTDPGFQEDPYPLLARLREEDPLHLTPDGIQVVTRYSDVRALLRESACVREFPARRYALSGRGGATAQSFARAIVSRDPPAHTRLRGLLSPPFTPGAARALRATVETLVDTLFDEAEARHGAVIDIMRDVADRLPYLVNCVVLGLPTAEYRTLAPWVTAIEDASVPSPPPEAVLASDRAIEALRDYLTPFFLGHRRPDPDGLLARLAGTDHTGSGFSRDELVDNAIGLFPAGAETVTGLIGNLVWLLAGDPEQWDLVRRDPAARPRAIEEALRFESPINVAYRWATAEVTVDSGVITGGRVLVLSLAAANRDPRVFAHPDRFDCRPTGRTPNVAFGSGRHVCLGAHLARLQGEAVLDRLLRRYPGLQLAGAPVRKPSVELRCLQRLPVRLARH